MAGRVVPKRDLQVRWRPYSLSLRDGPQGLQRFTVWLILSEPLLQAPCFLERRVGRR